MGLYANASHQAAQKIERATTRKTGSARWERRLLGNPPTGHCSDCPPLADMGWQPVGTLPDIGDTECGGFCWCWFEYSSDAEAPEVGKLRAPGSTKRKPQDTRPKGISVPQKVEVIQPAPTTEEIDAEVKKWIAGEPSKLTVKAVKPRKPVPDFELPEGYEWSSEDSALDHLTVP